MLEDIAEEKPHIKEMLKAKGYRGKVSEACGSG